MSQISYSIPWWSPIRRELSAVWTKYIHNSAQTWDTIYARNYETKLESESQRLRHYVVSGMLQELFPDRAIDLLDVGCGTATSFRYLSRQVSAYCGIDISTVAIDQARAHHAQDDRCAFQTISLLDYPEKRRFDVVLLNEVLYYAPFDEMTAHIEKAARLLDDDGVLLISMSDNPKAVAVWRWLARLGRPIRESRLRTDGLGNRWTVRAFKACQRGAARRSHR